MFDWVVKYLGFLKHVPVLPHVFDVMFKVISIFQNKYLLDYIDDIEAEITSWQNTSVTAHKYGGIQFNKHAHELGHLHGNGLLDVLFSRNQKALVMKQYPVQDHHVFKNSGWVSFRIKTDKDKQMAIDLLRHAYLWRQ